MAAPNSTISQILSTTLSNYRTELTDLIFTGTKLGKILMAKPGFKMMEQGGATIRIPIEYALNTNVKAMGEFDQYTTIPQDTFTCAEFNWLSDAGTVVITNKERVQNSGKYAVIKLAEAKVMNLKKSAQREINRQMFIGASGNEFAGLTSIVKTTGTYGGIPRSGNTWWQGNVDSTVELLTISDMRDLFNVCSKNVTAPDVIATTRTLYAKYEDLAQSFQQIVQSTKGDVGFDHLQYKGVPLFYDDHCPDTDLFMLNSEYLHLYVHPDWEWTTGETIRPSQALEIIPIEFWGNFCCSGPEFQGLLSGKS